MNIRIKLQKEVKLNNLTTSILAKYLLDYQGSYDELKVKSLCLESHVSHSTPTRLAKNLGFAGFSQLKYELINNHNLLQSRMLNQVYDIDINNYQKELSNAITLSFSTINKSDIILLANLLSSFKIIKLYGLGTSHTLAYELSSKLIRFNKIPIYPLNESDLCALSLYFSVDELVIGLSYSGETQSVISALDKAYKLGSQVVLFTNNPKFRNKYTKVFYLNIDPKTNVDSSTIYKAIMLILFDLLYIKMVDMNPKYKEITDFNQ